MRQPNPSRHTIEDLEARGAQARKEAKYSYAQSRYAQALALREQLDGPNDLRVAHTLTILGELAQTRIHFEDAETYYQRALAISEQHLGPEHPQIITCLDDVAGIYDAQGKYEQAEALYRRAVTLAEHIRGDHPDTAKARSKLARFLHARGEDHAALALFTNALALYGRAPETDPLDVAPVLNNLAVLYLDLHHPELAEPLLHRALTTWKLSLGDNHPCVATTLQHLGTVALQQQEYPQAARFYEQALAIHEHIWTGPYHPSTAAILVARAELQVQRHNWGAAEDDLQKALSILIHTLGAEHPETLAVQATSQAVHDRHEEAKLA